MPQRRYPRFPNSPVMRILMTPGIWLQKITTKDPTRDQIEVAVASFETMHRLETESAAGAATDAAAGEPSAPPLS